MKNSNITCVYYDINIDSEYYIQQLFLYSVKFDGNSFRGICYITKEDLMKIRNEETLCV